MESLANWVAPIATALAACMTAANLGSRVTGWGFVVFTIGSVTWTAYAAATGQNGLLWQSAFLTLVNAVGIWRWLGRQASIDDGARAASERSETTPGPRLFPATLLQGAPLDAAGARAGTVADAMIRCDDGGIDYLVLTTGGVAGVGETLHALPWRQARMESDRIVTALTREEVAALRPLSRDDWPTH